MDPTPDYSNLIKQLETVSQQPPQDVETRRHIAAALRRAQAALESPLDIVNRISYSPLQLIVAKIAIDMNIFQVLSKETSKSPLSVEAIAAGTSTPQPFLARILRFLAAGNMLVQPTPGTYAPNSTTHSLAQSGFSAAIQHHFEVQLPVWSALPAFLASRSYQPPSSATDTPFQIAHSTSLPAFQYAATKPQLMAHFVQWMAVQRQGEETFLKVMSHSDILGAEMRPEPSARALFVDVGGGLGHQCRGLRAWLPKDRSEKIVLQDLPAVVSKAGKIEGIQVMPHDFWGEQPVKGARFYYLRNVLHDYANEACKIILRHIKDAMLPDSKILIDELVLPDRIDGPSSDAETNASLDILLMASLAGQERTEAEWYRLIEGEGLVVREIRKYHHRGHSLLIVQREG